MEGDVKRVAMEMIVLYEMPGMLWQMLGKPDPALPVQEIYENRKLVEVSNKKENVPVENEAGLIHVQQLSKMSHAYHRGVEQTTTRH